jgi:hypothetical protein
MRLGLVLYQTGLVGTQPLKLRCVQCRMSSELTSGNFPIWEAPALKGSRVLRFVTKPEQKHGRKRVLGCGHLPKPRGNDSCRVTPRNLLLLQLFLP